MSMDQFLNSQVGRQFFADVSGIRKSLEQIAECQLKLANPLIVATVEGDPNPNYEDHQWVSETQVLNMLHGAGLTPSTFQKNDPGVLTHYVERKRRPLPAPKERGYWLPSVLQWVADEDKAREGWRRGAAKRAANKETVK